MEDYLWILIIISITLVWKIISWIIKTISNSRKYIKLKPKLDNLDFSIREHESKVEEWNAKVQNDKEEILKIARQKSMGFPWLAEAYADYFALKDEKLEQYLKYKKHPARTAAEHVRAIKKEKRKLMKENKIVSYKITYFEKLKLLYFSGHRVKNFLSCTERRCPQRSP